MDFALRAADKGSQGEATWEEVGVVFRAEMREPHGGSPHGSVWPSDEGISGFRVAEMHVLSWTI